MADENDSSERSRLAQNAAAQGGLFATNKWFVPWARPYIKAAAGRFADAAAYRSALQNPKVVSRLQHLATQSAKSLERLGSTEAAEHFLRTLPPQTERILQELAGDAAVRGFSASGTTRFVGGALELPLPSRFATWVHGLHRPGFLRLPKWKWVSTAGGAVQRGVVKAIEGTTSTGLTGGAVSGFLKGVAKQALSKKGLAAGFAAQGVWDTGSGLIDFVRAPGHVSDLSSSDWKRVAKAAGLRSLSGFVRGIDGALFGLIPNRALKLAGADDASYNDVDIDSYASSNSPAYRRYQRMQALTANGKEPTASELAQAAKDYQEEVEANWAKGLNEYGDVETTDAQELEKRAKYQADRKTRTAALAERRKKLLYDYDKGRQTVNAPDRESVRQALMYVSNEFDRRRELLKPYDSLDAFTEAFYDPDPAKSRLKGDAWRTFSRRSGSVSENDEARRQFWERHRNAAYEQLARDTGRQLDRIKQFAGYEELLAAQTDAARAVYNSVARSRGYAASEMNDGFNALWDRLPEFQRATLDMDDFKAQLSAQGKED